MIHTNLLVRESGLPNYKGLCIPIPSCFNFKFPREALKDYHDYEVVDLLKFGFPLSHDGITGAKTVPKNHTGAREWPGEIRRILNKEVASRSALGPFTVSPFGRDTYLSPLNSVPRKDSEERRLILDLSYPGATRLMMAYLKMNIYTKRVS